MRMQTSTECRRIFTGRCLSGSRRQLWLDQPGSDFCFCHFDGVAGHPGCWCCFWTGWWAGGLDGLAERAQPHGRCPDQLYFPTHQLFAGPQDTGDRHTLFWVGGGRFCHGRYPLVCIKRNRWLAAYHWAKTIKDHLRISPSFLPVCFCCCSWPFGFICSPSFPFTSRPHAFRK